MKSKFEVTVDTGILSRFSCFMETCIHNEHLQAKQVCLGIVCLKPRGHPSSDIFSRLLYFISTLLQKKAMPVKASPLWFMK
jgi:hypothetical protein